ncbi:MAG: MarR family transcriptional regulator [Nitrospirae bacterium]|nr:MAG: MarR family transcriptional regulator [Nitrospirota bacterium]
MARKPTVDPSRDPFMQVLRPLVETYFAFIRRDEPHIRSLGLTSSQFDVIVTLGDTEGMTCKDLSEKTLVTKGTLTGVLDRLEKKGLVERVPSRDDRRCTLIRLTPKGDARFRQVFPTHIRHLKPYFERALTTAEASKLRQLLLRLKDSFEKP